MPEYLDRGEGRIAYDTAGSGPLVVCVPGMGDLRSSYRSLAPALVEAGYQVVTMDLRGHGDSDVGFSAYDEDAIAGDVLALVQELGGPALLVGSSLGGDAVLRAAARQPDRVSGLVLLDAVLHGGPAALMVLFRLVLARPWGPALWLWYYKSLFKSRKPADMAEQVGRIRSSMREPGRFRAFQLTARSRHEGTDAIAATVSAPTLVVAGSKDPDLGDAAAEAARQGELLHGEVLVVDGAGHYPHVEVPEQVVPAVVAFADAHRA